MIHQKYQKHLSYPALAAMLAFIFLAVPDSMVRSQSVADNAPPPLKSGSPPALKRTTKDVTAGPTSAGNLIAKWTTDFGSSEEANAVAVQSDGKIVVAGTANASLDSNRADNDFAVFRYNTNGSLDTSFDGDGKVTTPFSTDFNNWDVAYAVAIQPDGKIIAAGATGGTGGSSFALARYNTDGSLDLSFGGGGKVVGPINAWITDIALQTDGKIVVAGSYGFTVARYNGNGSLDASFGAGGIATTDFGDPEQSARSVAVQADGRIVAAGYTGYCDKDKNCFFDFALTRYNTDGSLDTSFDEDGKLTTTFGVDVASARAVAIQPNGKIVAAGDTGYGDGRLVFARYNADGSPDPSFNGDGKVMTSFGGFSILSSAVIQSDGKIVASGYVAVGTGENFALIRLNTDGSLDTSFDGDGKVTTDFGNRDFGEDVAIQPDGKLVIAGSSGSYDGYSTFDFAIARYNVDGSLDPAFDSDGKQTTSLVDVSSAASAIVTYERSGFYPARFFVGYSDRGGNQDFAIANENGQRTITPIGNFDDRANAAAIDQVSSYIVAAGYSYNGMNKDLALVRYFQNLAVDPHFGTNGRVTTDFGANEEATAVAIQADHKILVVGKTDINGGAALVLARYNYNGSLDTSFGAGGRVIVQAIQDPKAMAIQPDGKIVAAGSAPNPGPPFGDDFAMARFNPDGSLDASFGSDGIVTTRFDLSSHINAIALEPYGKIVAAGFTRNDAGSISEFALARYNGDGSLDTSFDADGKVTTSFAQRSEANSVRVQRNGKIVAAGVNFSSATARDFALARYNADGSLDISFDDDGKQTTDFFGDDDDASAVAIQQDGNILTAGSADRGAKFDLAAALYTGDSVQRNVLFDFDGDGLSDVSVFRPGNSGWYLNRSTEGFSAVQLGNPTDRIVPADYDGDGKTDIAVYRPETGSWYWLSSRSGTLGAVQFGSSEDLPVPADYDHDGKADISVFRPSNGVWYRLNSRNGSFDGVQFGTAGDKPTIGDYDGDGRADIAVFRPSTDTWYRLNSSDGQFVAIPFGLSTDLVTPADFDGDGKTDVAVYRAATGAWYSLDSSNGALRTTQFGTAEDQPTAADFDGDGRADVSVFRPSDGVWYRLNSSNGSFFAVQFGTNGDRPTPAAFLY